MSESLQDRRRGEQGKHRGIYADIGKSLQIRVEAGCALQCWMVKAETPIHILLCNVTYIAMHISK